MATTLPMDGQFELDANFFGVPDQTFPEIDLSFYNSSDQTQFLDVAGLGLSGVEQPLLTGPQPLVEDSPSRTGDGSGPSSPQGLAGSPPIPTTATDSIPYTPAISSPNDNSSASTAGMPARKACDNCKRTHTKCSGDHPICLQCKKRGTTCVYSVAKRRGPRSGALRELQDQVRVLSEVIRQQKAQLLQKSLQEQQQQQQQQLIVLPGVKRSRSEPPGLGQRMDFSTSTFLKEYIRIFEEYVQPCCSTFSSADLCTPAVCQTLGDSNVSKSTLDCVNSLLKIPMATTEIRVAKSLMSMYAMLATGAQVFGNRVHAQEFISRARTAAAQLFDVSDMQVAAGFDRMAFFFIGEGELDKARVYNSLALQVCENLGVPVTHDVHVSCLLGRAILSPHPDEARDIAKRLLAAGSGHAFVIGAMVLGKATLRDWRVTGRKVVAEELVPLFDRAEENICLMHASARRKDTTRIMLCGLRAGVLMAAGRLDLAVAYADQATELASQLGMGQYSSFCAANGIEWSAEVHRAAGSLTMLQRDCEVLDAVASKFPVVSEIAKRCRQGLALTHTSAQADLSASSPTLQLPFEDRPASLRQDLDLIEKLFTVDEENIMLSAAKGADEAYPFP